MTATRITALRASLPRHPEYTPTPVCDLKDAIRIATEALAGWEESQAEVARLTALLPSNDGQRTPTLCVECGPNVHIDEDGCCVTCGNGATGSWLLAATEPK